MTPHKIHINLPAGLDIDRLQFFGEALEDFSTSFTLDCNDTAPYNSVGTTEEHSPCRSITWYCESAPPAAPVLLDILNRALENIDIGALTLTAQMIEITELPDENWLEKSYQSFPPFTVGPFFIHGDHYNAETDGDIPAGQMPIEINAATAFGSGEHGTTKGCLLAMIDLKAQGVCPWNVLDIGTGSGILAIAAWKLWQTPILASDIDEEAIRVTRKHLEINGVREASSALTCSVGAGFEAPLVRNKAPYELIIANILAGPLMEMAGDIARALDSNSYTILSGILGRREDEVRGAFETAGLTLKKRYDIDGWSTLLMHKV